jgi:hypothetical protein
MDRVLLTELTPGIIVNDSYVPRDSRTFAKPLSVGPATPPALAPQIGLWWNPDEPGSGYALDYKHGVLVVTVYSYTSAGAAQWYLASGPLSGAVFSATLDKYSGGQCIACTLAVKPALVGNDGIITITFSSPTSATVSLPAADHTDPTSSVLGNKGAASGADLDRRLLANYAASAFDQLIRPQLSGWATPQTETNGHLSRL